MNIRKFWRKTCSGYQREIIRSEYLPDTKTKENRENEKYLAILSVAGIILIGSMQAQAITIVDTGQPPLTPPYSAWYLRTGQWLASEFTIDQPYTLTDIQGFMYADPNWSNPRTLTLAIYGDGGEVPNVSQQLFNKTFSIGAGNSYGWYGLSELSWYLLPGSYWVAFEVRSGQKYYAPMASGSPNPLKGAYDPMGGYGYIPNDYLKLGIRICDNSTPVPEPATLLLISSGLAGLGLLGRKKFTRRVGGVSTQAKGISNEN